MLREIRVESVEELKGRIYKYFYEINERGILSFTTGSGDWVIDVNGDLNTTTLLDDNV